MTLNALLEDLGISEKGVVSSVADVRTKLAELAAKGDLKLDPPPKTYGEEVAEDLFSFNDYPGAVILAGPLITAGPNSGRFSQIAFHCTRPIASQLKKDIAAEIDQAVRKSRIGTVLECARVAETAGYGETDDVTLQRKNIYGAILRVALPRLKASADSLQQSERTLGREEALQECLEIIRDDSRIADDSRYVLEQKLTDRVRDLGNTAMAGCDSSCGDGCPADKEKVTIRTAA